MSCFSFQVARKIRGYCPKMGAGSACLLPLDTADALAQRGLGWTWVGFPQPTAAWPGSREVLNQTWAAEGRDRINSGNKKLFLKQKCLGSVTNHSLRWTKGAVCVSLVVSFPPYDALAISLMPALACGRKAPDLLHLVPLPGKDTHA